MWFALGVLCGVLVCVVVLLCLPKEKCRPHANTVRGNKTPHTEWGETHNFLYYDGTEMPVVKEDLHEQ